MSSCARRRTASRPTSHHKLIALAAPDLVAPAFSSVIASIVFDELKSGGNPVRVTKAQRDAIVAFYRRNNFAPIWVSRDGLNKQGEAHFGADGQGRR